jgi:ArsR family transcriptional regulator
LVLRISADFFNTLGHPARIKIIKLLASGERCVCDLIPALELEQSNLSQHLAVLRRKGIISSRKEGTKVLYRILYPSVLAVLAAVEKTLEEQLSNSHDLLKHLQE